MISNVTEKIKELRRSKEYRVWHEMVLSRDKVCVICGNNKYLEVDHIKPLALFPNLALKLDNGRVLCKMCHKKTDTYGIFSRFKGDSPIHPVLAGDFLFKIKSLPLSIEIRSHGIDKQAGLTMKYQPASKNWIVGYKKHTQVGDTLEKAIDTLFEKLATSIFEKPPVEIKSKKQLRSDLWHKINDNKVEKSTASFVF